jgi:hypothetical protein
MLRRFASMCLSVLMLAALTSQTSSPVIAADPPALPVQPIDTPQIETIGSVEAISPVELASQSAASGALDCVFCVLSNWGGDERYTFILDNGNDLRVDGDVMVNHDAWYGGVQAIVRCGSSPCTPPTCYDWSPLPTDHRVQMCGHALYVDHSNGSTPTILSARTISLTGGWDGRIDTDVVHADQLAAPCPAHPRFLGYPPALQETNVCIGVPQIVDPLNDPANPGAIVPVPDFQALSSCPDGLCGPVASASCVAEPGTELRLPTGTFTSPNKLILAGAANQKKVTICPGLYFGGFSALGDGSAQPHVIMLPGTYAMIGGGFSVNGTASITTASSQGDGVTIYNTGAAESFTENFPSDATLVPVCDPAVSACNPTGTPVLNPPSTVPINAGTPVTYKLTVPKGIFVEAPAPTGTAASFAFYNGTTPIVCEAPGLTVTTVSTSLVATCTTRYATFGQKGITAVYAGDATYAPTGAAKTQAVIPAITASQDNIDLRTSAGPCAGIWNPFTDPCGRIIMHAPTSGRYSGLLLFQDRATGFLEGALAILLQPYLGAPACDTTPITTPLGEQPAFMAYGVVPDAHAVPDPCGPLGGLSGTIYAPHLASGSPADWDAVVEIMASGLANLQVIAAEVDVTTPGVQARLDARRLQPERLVLTPSSASIAPGVAQAYTVEAFDADGHSLGDVTGSSAFGIAPDGGCTGASCSATVAGSHTVTATNAGLTATATLTVIPGTFDHLGLVPADATIAAGGIQAYTAEGRDAYDNPLGTVAGVAFTIGPNGSCTSGKCTAKLAGVHTVTGTADGLTATTTLTVVPGPLDHLVLAPATASVLAGVAQPYTAEGRDRFNNTIGDVTAGTVFTIAPNGSCSGASCRATIVGNHTVTGVNAGKLGRATLSVKAGPLDHLALTPAAATIAFGGSQVYSATGRDAFDNPLGTQSGVVYTIGPDGGCTKAVCTPASVGVHTVTGTKTGLTGSATLTVTRASPTLAYTGQTTVVHGAPLTLSATLKRPGGAAIAGALISFTLDGMTRTAVTNALGVAAVNTTAPPTPGTYSISVVFAGDASFKSASLTKNLVVS